MQLRGNLSIDHRGIIFILGGERQFMGNSYEIGSVQETIPTKLVYDRFTNTCTFTPKAFSQGLRYSFTANFGEGTSHHSVSLNTTTNPPTIRDLPLLRVIASLNASFASHLTLRDSATGEKYLHFDAASREKSEYAFVAELANYARLFLDANRLLKRNGLIDKDMPWPKTHHVSAKFIRYLDLMVQALASTEKTVDVTFDFGLFGLPDHMGLIEVQDGQIKGVFRMEESFSLLEHTFYWSFTQEGPKIRMFSRGAEVFAKSLQEALRKHGDITVKLTHPQTKVELLQHNAVK